MPGSLEAVGRALKLADDLAKVSDGLWQGCEQHCEARQDQGQ